MRKHLLLSLLTAFLIPVLFSGCDNALAPLLPLSTNEMRVTIADYGSFDSNSLTTATDNTSWTIKAPIKGENGGDTLVITLVIPRKTTAPYTITVQSDNTSRINYCVQQTSGSCIDYDVFNGQGNGTITISSIDETSRIVQGTFSGSLVRLSGGSGSKSFSGGEFKFSY